MAEENPTQTPPIAPAEKPFSEWIGKILSGKTDNPSALQKRLLDVHGKHKALVEQAQKAEGHLLQVKEQISRIQGAAEQLVELLREEFGSQEG